MEQTFDRELDWNDEIERESDFTLLEDGDYDFVITLLERERHAGSAKLPPCPKAVVTLKIEDPEQGQTTIKHSLFLHTKTEGLLSAFFKSIGQKKSGERIRMDWNKVVGSKGRCKVVKEDYTKKDGSPGVRNSIKSFYESVEVPAQPSAAPYVAPVQQMQPKKFTPGTF